MSAVEDPEMPVETPEIGVDKEVQDDPALFKKPVDPIDEEGSTGFTIYGKSLTEAFMLLLKASLSLLLVVYLLAAFIIDFERAKFLFVSTVAALLYTGMSYLSSMNPEKTEEMETKVTVFLDKVENNNMVGKVVSSIMLGIMVIIAAVEIDDSRNLISALGLAACVLFTWLFSYHPGKVKWRPVIGSLFIQYMFGYFIMRTWWGLNAIEFCADQFTYLLEYTYAGSGFVFGWLTDGSLFGRPFQLADGNSYFLGPPLFTNVLPSVIFFSSLVSMLYYLRVLPFLVKNMGKSF